MKKDIDPTASLLPDLEALDTLSLEPALPVPDFGGSEHKVI